MAETDPYERLSYAAYERMIDRGTAQLTADDWQAIRQMLVIQWRDRGVEAWVLDILSRADPKTSRHLRRFAFDLATQGTGRSA